MNTEKLIANVLMLIVLGGGIYFIFRYLVSPVLNSKNEMDLIQNGTVSADEIPDQKIKIDLDFKRHRVADVKKNYSYGKAIYEVWLSRHEHETHVTYEDYPPVRKGHDFITVHDLTTNTLCGVINMTTGEHANLVPDIDAVSRYYRSYLFDSSVSSKLGGRPASINKYAVSPWGFQCVHVRPRVEAFIQKCINAA